MGTEFDGLLTFMASHHAIRADTALRRAGLSAALVPGPKDLSPNCGTAVRFRLDEWPQVSSELIAKGVEIDEVHRWTPRTDAWSRPDRDSVS